MDEALRETVVRHVGAQPHVVLDVVVDELEGLARRGSPIRALATATLGQLGWLGEPVETNALVDPGRAVQIQDILRGGRSLRHPREHWAESVAMAMAERLTQVDAHLLSEDYDARIESVRHGLTPFSIHKVLSHMVRNGHIPAEEAVSFADALKAANRGIGYTAEEFRSGRLRRVGRP